MISPRKMAALAGGAALGLILAAVPAVVASKQQPQQPEQQPSTDTRGIIRSRVELVVVPVTVKNHDGSLANGIGQNEFRVFDDGVEQHISLFSTDPFPLSAILLVDGDLSSRAVEEVQKNLVAAAGGFSESDEVAVARFGAFYTPVADFTASNDRLISELMQFDFTAPLPGTASQVISDAPPGSGPAGPVAQNPTKGLNTKHINDALFSAAQVLQQRARDRRKVVLLISDGVNARNNTHNYDETLRQLLSSDISVYAIGVDQAFYKRKTSLLAKYAHATGGDVFYAGNGATLSKLFSDICDEARHQYTIGYVPTGTDPAKDYHSIEVRVRRPGLTLLTRDGYYLLSRPLAP